MAAGLRARVHVYAAAEGTREERKKENQTPSRRGDKRERRRGERSTTDEKPKKSTKKEEEKSTGSDQAQTRMLPKDENHKRYMMTTGCKAPSTNQDETHGLHQK